MTAKQPDTQATTMSGSSTLAELDDPPSPDGRQGGNDGTQNGDRSSVSRPEPSSGGFTEPTAAAATAAATGPGPSDPAVNLLGMLHRMQENQLQAQLQAQQFQQQF